MVARGSRPNRRPVTISSTTPVAKRKDVRQLHRRRLQSRDRRQRVQNLLQRQILAAQNVALARSSLFPAPAYVLARTPSRPPDSIPSPHRRETFASENPARSAPSESASHRARRSASSDSPITTSHPAAPGLHRHLLRHELRPLVVPDHVSRAKPECLRPQRRVRSVWLNPIVATLDV